MRKTIMTIAAISVGTLAAFAATPTVSNVTAKQRYPWNGMVDITCDVSGISGMVSNLEFTVAAVNSGSVHKISQFWVVKDGTNTTDHAIHTNGTYHLVWDSKVDFDNQICSNMVMRVNLAVLPDKVQLWENGPYWATTNIGAENPWDSGYYFWWGDTIGYKYVNRAWVASDGSSSNFSFESDNTPTCGKDHAALQSEGWITADGVLAPEHDAAHVQWGGSWRMPTRAEFSDLIYNCTTTWVTTNGVYGKLVTGKGDYASKSIFLPAGGNGERTWLDSSGPDGYYWSSVPWPDGYDDAAEYYSFYGEFSYTEFKPYLLNRCNGRPVRPIQGFTK